MVGTIAENGVPKFRRESIPVVPLKSAVTLDRTNTASKKIVCILNALDEPSNCSTSSLI